MLVESNRIFVTWLASIAAPDTDDMSFDVGGFNSLSTWRADVVVLDLREFPCSDDLLRARAAVDAPVLVLCDAVSLENIAPRLADQDGFSLYDEPPYAMLERIRRLHRRALPRRDRLTGLLDRRYFMRQLEEAMGNASRENPRSLVMVDLDHFKAINDEHGHACGDHILIGTARCVEASVPASAVVARIGGEEIGILVEMGHQQASSLAAQVLENLRAEPIAGVEVTASAGSATAAEPMDARKVYRRCDEALYAAKANGRNRTVHFEDLERTALCEKRDLTLEGFQNRTRVITERAAEVIARSGRRLMEELRSEADLDVLTGLFSRRYLDRQLAAQFEVAAQGGNALTVALMDVDHFGRVNKEFGWPSGDRILADIAQRVRSHVRESDWVARYGGEEICLVMHGTITEADTVLRRLHSSIAQQPFTTTTGEAVAVTVSIGATACSDLDDNVGMFMERVSQRLLLAKRGGRNRVVTD
ncbi:MAG: hypothetical protein A2289_17755 [Deltaproteobacteria bacterium RIFOXYA12_FULL_58_15]|nr:MAG: hypothetical protein A2289_17755 [Deltaproteobacteria bacterium RIFOXYA12_FULL_58_15]